MKHLKFFFACLLMTAFSIGQMWATESTYTWTLASGDLGTADSPATSVSKGSPSTTWSVDWTWNDNSKKYLGFESSGSQRGLQIGKGTAGYGGTTIVLSTSGISGTITSVKVNSAIAASGGANLSVQVGSSDFEYNENTSVALTTTATEYDFVGSASGTITITQVNTVTGKGMYIKSIEVTYSTGGSTTCATPTFSPAAGAVVSGTTVTLTTSTADADIYYTMGATPADPTTSSSHYTSPIEITEATTIKAIAVKDGLDNSAVATASYTVVEPLTTMQAIFDAATTAGSTATDVYITFDGWQISGVKNKNAFLTDGTKGAVIYSTSNSDFVENNVLSGTVACKVQLFKQFAEITSLTAGSTGLTVTTGSALTPIVKTIDQLSAVNTGALVTVENLDYNGTNLSDGVNTIVTYNTFYTASLENGKKYNITGVFQYYDGTKQLLPRSAADVQLVSSKTLSSISLSGTYPTTFEQGDDFSHAGMTVTANYTDETTGDVTASATFTGYNMSTTGEQTVTVSYTENAVTKTYDYTINVNAPTPTGDWELFEGDLSDLTAGNYLIYEDGSAMLAQISSNRFAYETETPDANGIISNPSRYAVWTLAKSGDYWTFYNAKAGMYAAGTGVSGKAQLLVDGTDDKALWSISDELAITNKYNADNSVNATLRHNVNGTSNYGFACYASSTGAQPVFYKPATPSYYITETLTGCTASGTNPAKVPQSLTEDVVLNYNLTVGYAWPVAITVEVGGVALDPADYTWNTSVSPAALTIDHTVVNGDIAVTIVAQTRELDYITIIQAPTKTSYYVGDLFNPAGLEIQLNYTAGDPETVVYNDGTKDGFTFLPNLETALTIDDNEVVVSYGGKSANQAITVTVPTPVEKTVVIIAEYESNLYAMSTGVSSSACAAISVTKDGGNLVVSSEEDKAAVQWFMTKLGSNVKLQVANNTGQYLSAGSSAAMSLVDEVVNWNYSEVDGKYLISKDASRAIMYQSSGNIFKHYATSNTEGYAKVSEIFEVAEGATNIVVVTPVVHEFSVDPDEAVAFGTVNKDDVVTPKSFDVTLTNIDNATVTLGGTGAAAFSINQTALTANGTITVTPNTANVGNYSATITLSDDAGVAADKVINVTMKVVEPRDCDRTDDFSTVGANSSYTGRTSTEGWTAVNTAVAVKDEVTYWIMQGNTNSVGVITSPEFNYGIQELSLSYYYPFGESNGISFKVEIMQGGIAVKTETITKADAVQNTVYDATIENINVEGKYQIVITNLSPTGSTSSKDRFAVGNLCWKKYGDPVYEDVRTGLSAGHYYTICYNKKMTAVRGASLWQFIGKDASFAYLEKASAPYPAGKPYVLYAESNKLEAVVDGDETNAPGANGAIHGTFSNLSQDQLNNYATVAGSDLYLVIGDELRRATGYALDGITPLTGNSLPAHRAFVVVADIPNETPAPMPGRQVRSMGLPKDTPTAIDNAEASDKPVKKLINGNLFILRGEKMYNANGQVVK